MKLTSLLNWQAVARGFGGLALWRIRSESESSVGDGDRLPQAENLPSLITVIIIDLERGAPSTGVIRAHSHTPCSSAVTKPAEIEIFFFPILSHLRGESLFVDRREIGVKFSSVNSPPQCRSPLFPWFPGVWQTAKHRKQQEMSLRTLRCKISGVLGLYVQSFQILLCFFVLNGWFHLIVYSSGPSVYCARYFIVRGVVLCLFCKTGWLVILIGFSSCVFG